MSFRDNIIQSMEKLTTLEIVTAVGPTLLDANGKPTFGQDGLVMATRIGLLDGDVITKMDETFVTGIHTALRPFHEEQVGRGLQIVKDNIAALKELYLLFQQVEAGAPSATATPSVPPKP